MISSDFQPPFLCLYCWPYRLDALPQLPRWRWSPPTLDRRLTIRACRAPPILLLATLSPYSGQTESIPSIGTNSSSLAGPFARFASGSGSGSGSGSCILQLSALLAPAPAHSSSYWHRLLRAPALCSLSSGSCILQLSALGTCVLGSQLSALGTWLLALGSCVLLSPMFP